MNQEKLFNIEEELKKLPNSPGVYIMHDKYDGILYVGKAINLHNRVRQYFQTGHGHSGFRVQSYKGTQTKIQYSYDR